MRYRIPRPTPEFASALVLVGCLATTGLTGQTTLVIPAAYSTTEAPSQAFWAVTPYRSQRQLLLDESQLREIKGKRITEIRMRANTGGVASLERGMVDMRVYMSRAPVSADDASTRLADNRGNRRSRVFSGRVVLPAMPDLSSGPAPFNVVLRLTPAFRYDGGTLCVETFSTPVPIGGEHPWWPIDAVTDSGVGGSVMRFGQSCIPTLPGQPAGAVASTLVPGATATFFLQGRADHTHVLHYFGFDDQQWGGQPLPLELRAFGASGCYVYIALKFMQPAQLVRQGVSGHRYASVDVPIPTNPAAVGFKVFSQWVSFRGNGPFGFGLSTSNAVLGRIGPPAPLTGVAWVEATDAQTGRIVRGRMPVLKFGTR